MTPTPCDQWTRTRGLTLLELVIGLAITSILVGGLASALAIATRSIDTGDSVAARLPETSRVLEEVASDVKLAVDISELTPTSIEVTVPDRDDPPDGPETIRYSWSGHAGDPLLREYNDGPAIVFLESVHHFDLQSLTRTLDGPAAVALPVLDPNAWGYYDSETFDVLLVVNSEAALTPAEVVRRDLLVSWGFEVTPIDDSTPVDDLLTSAMLHDAVYVPSTADATELGTKLRFAAAGIVVEHPDQCVDLALSGSVTRFLETRVDIVDPGHPITLGWPGAPLKLTHWTQPLSHLSGALASGDVIGAPEGTLAPALAVVNTGSLLTDSTLAVARRVHLPWADTGFDIDALNANGQLVLQRSLMWAARRSLSHVTPPQTVAVRIALTEDDARQRDGGVLLTNTVIRLGQAARFNGMRFDGVDIPQGATILHAYVELIATDANDLDVTALIEGQASDAALAFTVTPDDITNRPRTTARLSWSPPAWIADYEYEMDGIEPIVEEIVNRPGWRSGNPLVLIVSPDTGNKRRAASFDDARAAPLLYVEYEP